MSQEQESGPLLAGGQNAGRQLAEGQGTGRRLSEGQNGGRRSNPEAKPLKKTPGGSMRSWQAEVLSWCLMLGLPVLLVLFLLSRVFALSTVNQVSMRETLVDGDLVFCTRSDFTMHPPERGDIVLFYADNRERGSLLWEFGMRFTDMADNWRCSTERRNLRYVKRVIGLPGETVDLRDGMVYIEGEPLVETYVTSLTEERDMVFPMVVPDGEVLLLGDNRYFSEDSRDFGCIRLGALEGRVRLRLLPLGTAGRVD